MVLTELDADWSWVIVMDEQSRFCQYYYPDMEKVRCMMLVGSAIAKTLADFEEASARQ